MNLDAFRMRGSWFCLVDGKPYGPWPDKGSATAGYQVELRRVNERKLIRKLIPPVAPGYGVLRMPISVDRLDYAKSSRTAVCPCCGSRFTLVLLVEQTTHDATDASSRT